ncbi:MAG: response regulator transcription factor [Bacteroidales bacterium]|nr:response regulator transcription factor [Bacteroidales bacterium]
MIPSVIIDDSKDAIEFLSDMLKNYLPQVEIVGFAQNVDSGISLINEYKPELLFLDIELNNKTAFDLLKGIPEIDFDVIFITAYNRYAIEAFDHNAIHYLLKPVEPVKLIEAVSRVEKQKDNRKTEKQLRFLNIESLENQLNKKVAVNTEKEIRFIKLSEIRYVNGEGRYSVIFLDSGEKIMVSKLLKEIEEQFAAKELYRVNKSYLINLNHVKSVKHVDGGIIVMTDNSNIEIPRRKRNDFTIRMTKFMT